MSFYIPYVVGSAGLMLGNYLYNYIYDDSKLVIELVPVPSLTPNSFYPLPANKVISYPSLTPNSYYPLPSNKIINIDSFEIL